MINRKITFCLSLLITLSAYGQQKTNKKNEENMERVKNIYYSNVNKDESKHRYTFNVHSKACQYQVYIDGILAFNWKGERAKSGGTATVPINSLILHGGIHRYTVKMYPENGKPLLGYKDTLVSGKEYIRIGVVEIEFAYSPKYDIREKTRLGSITSYNDNDETYQAMGKLPYYEFSGEFEAFNLPAECEGWSNSLNLAKWCEDEQAKKVLKQDLYKKYQEIHAILKAKDVDQFVELIKKREQLIDAMHCFDDLDIRVRSKEILNTIDNPDEILQPLPSIQDVKMEFMGYGKLVTLVDKEGRGIIQYVDKDENLSALDFRVHKKSDKKSFEVIY